MMYYVHKLLIKSQSRDFFCHGMKNHFEMYNNLYIDKNRQHVHVIPILLPHSDNGLLTQVCLISYRDIEYSNQY